MKTTTTTTEEATISTTTSTTASSSTSSALLNVNETSSALSEWLLTVACDAPTIPDLIQGYAATLESLLKQLQQKQQEHHHLHHHHHSDSSSKSSSIVDRIFFGAVVLHPLTAARAWYWTRHNDNDSGHSAGDKDDDDDHDHDDYSTLIKGGGIVKETQWNRNEYLAKRQAFQTMNGAYRRIIVRPSMMHCKLKERTSGGLEEQSAVVLV